MLESFLAGAKATIKRAGAVDSGFSSPNTSFPGHQHEDKIAERSTNASSNNSSCRAGEDRGHICDGDGNESSLMSPVPRLFSTFKASDAASAVNKVGRKVRRLQLQRWHLFTERIDSAFTRTLSVDKDAASARGTVRKYRTLLSTALSDAASAAVKRREERCLLVAALKRQQNDLRCWGYLSVLPSFSERRRQETTRADLRTKLAEQQAKILSVRHEEAIRLLRSMPITEVWSIPRVASSSAGRDTQPARRGDGAIDGGCTKSADISSRGLSFEEKAFIVSPPELLSNSPALASTKRKLKLCDQACAAAADAFARKVVDAGGLEPRSHDERAQMLLNLLSRYHVLARSIGGEEMTGVTKRLPPLPSRSLPDTRSREEASPTSSSGGATQLPNGDGVPLTATAEDVTSFQPTADEEKNVPLNEVDATSRGGETGEGQRLSPSSRETAGVNPDSAVVDADTAGGAVAPETATTAGDEVLAYAPRDRLGSEPPKVIDGDSATKMSVVGSSDVGARSFNGIAGVPIRGDDVDGMEIRKEGRISCEEAFLELMSDERFPEGRLLRRFLKMASAEKPPVRMSSFTTSTTIERALTMIGSLRGSRGSEERGRSSSTNRAHDEDGPIGPQVVKAFVNYFSKEYLKGRFDVPDLLVPILTQLVASLVFGQARSLVLGYDRDRVIRSDALWREKARAMRSLSLVELGASSEYMLFHHDPPAPSRCPANSRGEICEEDKGAQGEFGGNELGELGAEKGVTFEEARAFVGGGGAGVTGTGQSDAVSDHGGDGDLPEGAENSGEKAAMGSEVFSCVNVRVMTTAGKVSRVGGGRDDDGDRGDRSGPITAPTASDAMSDTAARRGSENAPARRIASDSSLREGGEKLVIRVNPTSEKECMGNSGTSVLLEAAQETTEGLAAGGDNSDEDSTAVVSATEELGCIETKQGSSVVERPASLSSLPKDCAASAAMLEKRDETDQSDEVVVQGANSASFNTEPCGLSAGEVEAGPVMLGLGISKAGSTNIGFEVAAVRAYAAASREFGRLRHCITPEDMLVVVRDGMTLLADEAKRISASEKPLDADTLIPLVVYALVHAKLPRIHESLNFLRNFRGPSWGGEEAYHVTCIEAAVSFVLDWNADNTRSTGGEGAPDFSDDAGDAVGKKMWEMPEVTGAGNEEDLAKKEEERRAALTRLGIFLENHKTQENTVYALSSTGWL